MMTSARGEPIRTRDSTGTLTPASMSLTITLVNLVTVCFSVYSSEFGDDKERRR
jgi:hypothetical protein